MTDEQIEQWTIRITDIISKESTEDAVRALIASVRAEAIEECAKALEDAPLTYAGPDPSIVANLRYLMVAAVRDRALVKERKGHDV